MKVLVIDVGGTNVKAWCPVNNKRFKIRSGSKFKPENLFQLLTELLGSFSKYDGISIGVPAPVKSGRILKEPVNLGSGWVDFSFEKYFSKPTKLINDAVMQAVGSYRGGRMFFMGLGTGLGTAMIVDHYVIPLEVQHLPFQKEFTFEQILGKKSRQNNGHEKWEKNLSTVVDLFFKAFLPDEIVLGGGLVKHLDYLPKNTRCGDNKNAIEGGIRLWTEERYKFP